MADIRRKSITNKNRPQTGSLSRQNTLKRNQKYSKMNSNKTTINNKSKLPGIKNGQSLLAKTNPLSNPHLDEFERI